MGAGGALASAWPASPDENAYSTLVISGALDGAPPTQNATHELLPHLRNGHQLLLSELQVGAFFASDTRELVWSYANAYHDNDGRSDTSAPHGRIGLTRRA